MVVFFFAGGIFFCLAVNNNENKHFYWKLELVGLIRFSCIKEINTVIFFLLLIHIEIYLQSSLVLFLSALFWLTGSITNFTHFPNKGILNEFH